jgi:ubiquinone/menaquinone biosynthesis C-methylase UbiE
MIELAKERSTAHPNIQYQVADATGIELPAEEFDCIASIATLHHLSMERMLVKMKKALKAGGVLVVLDLFQAEALTDLMSSAIALPASCCLRLIRTGRLRPPRQLREAWAEHSRTDTYLTLTQIRRICANVLPGARIKKHLFWRYSIVWEKTVIIN